MSAIQAIEQFENEVKGEIYDTSTGILYTFSAHDRYDVEYSVPRHVRFVVDSVTATNDACLVWYGSNAIGWWERIALSFGYHSLDVAGMGTMEKKAWKFLKQWEKEREQKQNEYHTMKEGQGG